MELPRLISVDDHVIEPAHAWQQHLPAHCRDADPVLVRRRGKPVFRGRTWLLDAGPRGD